MCAHLLWQWWISKLIQFLSAGQYFPLGQQMFTTSRSLLPSGISLSHHQGWEILPADGRPSLTAGRPKLSARGGTGCPEQSSWPQPLPNSPSTIHSSRALPHLFWKLRCTGLRTFLYTPLSYNQHSLKSVVSAAHSEQHLTGYWLAVIHFIKNQEGLKLLAPY